MRAGNVMPGAERLFGEIERVFPYVDTPPVSEIKAHGSDCPFCTDVADDIVNFKNKELGADEIGWLYQELSHLSPRAWCWLLPHYLRYCLTVEAQENCSEIEFFILRMGPSERFESDTEEKISLLNREQINVLQKFFVFLMSTDYWGGYAPHRIEKAISFLSKVTEKRK